MEKIIDKKIIIREPQFADENIFLQAVQKSKLLHHPWVTPPINSQEFNAYVQHFQQDNQKSFLVCDEENHLIGVINISEIVRGCFQNAYLGFYANADFIGNGYMSTGLKLVLEKAFNELKLHRLEANIQPNNIRSIKLVKKIGFRNEGFSPRYLKINNEWRGHEHWAMTYEDYIREDEATLKKDFVTIVPYNNDWPAQAKLEINTLIKLLPSEKFIDIQHVGSTAIPGLSAKPIIDLQIAVHSLEEIKTIAISTLHKLGYEYWDANPDPRRMFFVKGMPPFGEKRTHHIHIFEHESEHWQNKIIFRDYLRAHPDIAKDYEKLKNKLANEYTYDREKYTDEKLLFVNKILKLAAASK